MLKQLSIFLLFFLPFSAYTQVNPSFITYGINVGMPQSSIYGLNQDKNGFLWIGTAGGLCRFDGYQMKVYKQSNLDSRAIPSYKEFRFYNDSSGRMWIVSFNGISLYNSLTDNFTNVFVYSPKNVVIAENRFYGEDKDAETIFSNESEKQDASVTSLKQTLQNISAKCHTIIIIKATLALLLN